jgi:carbonic anhydrase
LSNIRVKAIDKVELFFYRYVHSNHSIIPSYITWRWCVATKYPKLNTMTVKMNTKNLLGLRKTEWNTHKFAYYNLLNSNTYIHNRHDSLLDVGFRYQDGSEFVFNLTVETIESLNLDNLVYKSVVRRPKLIWLPCMDERIQYLTSSHHALSLGMPGCECLLTGKEQRNIAKNIVAICQKHPSITEIVPSSHSSCGAVARAFALHKKQMNWVERLYTIIDGEDKTLDKVGAKYASTFAQVLKEELTNVQLDNVSIRTHHFAKNELHSKELHNAFGAVVNFDPTMNTADFEDTVDVPMFNIFAGGQSSEQVIQNIELATAIAGGDHGFGPTFFTGKTPFVLFFVANLTDQPDIHKELLDVVELLKNAAITIDIVYKILDTSS